MCTTTECRKLHAGEMHALSVLLNTAFTGAADSRHFEDGLPKMWVDDDAHMQKHIAVFENGNMAGAVGVYPYDVYIGGRKLRFATVGNIGVLPEYRGRGYMQLLMDAAMAELSALSVDVSRLGGLRSRYERYGYEMCGINYMVRLTQRNVSEANAGAGITFAPIGETDVQALDFADALYRKNAIACDRGSCRDRYAALCAWKNRPYLAVRDGEWIGYLSCAPGGGTVAEHGAVTPVLQTEMLCAWCAQSGRDEIRFEMYPWDPAFCHEVGRICETYSASAATQCKILRWDRFADALLRLKRTLMPLPAGRVVLGIGGFGALAMEVGADCTQVTVTTEVPAVSVDALTAARMLSGTLSPVLCAPLPDDAARLLGAWLPLPFSWNGQDRV